MTPQDIESTQVPQPAALPAQVVNPRDFANELVMTKAAGEFAAARIKYLKSSADEVFNLGERLTVVSPANPRKKLGKVNYTEPGDHAVVVDEKAFLADMQARFPEHIREQETVVATQAKLLDLLRQYAPADVVDSVVERKPVVADYMRNQILKVSTNAGEVLGPDGEMGEHAPAGVAIVEKSSSVTISLEKDAVDHLVGLWERGQVQLPGIPAADTSAA